jgi:hypothetical protein
MEGVGSVLSCALASSRRSRTEQITANTGTRQVARRRTSAEELLDDIRAGVVASIGCALRGPDYAV